MSSSYLYGCEYCGGPHNGGNCLGYNDLECSVPFDSPPLPCTDVLGDVKAYIELPLGEVDSLSMGDRYFKTRDLILEELTTEIGLDNSIPTEIDDGYYDSEGDILYLEQLLNEDTFFDVSPSLSSKVSSLLVSPLPDSKHICLREVERFDLFSP
ncbi:hypothetical protein Tco_1556276 [Tanacetum coccineum]